MLRRRRFGRQRLRIQLRVRWRAPGPAALRLPGARRRSARPGCRPRAPGRAAGRGDRDPAVGRLPAGQLGGAHDALEAAPVGDQRRDDDQAAGEERQHRVGRVLAEVLFLGVAVVAELAVDPVPPDEVVDAEGDDRQQGGRPGVADLDRSWVPRIVISWAIGAPLSVDRFAALEHRDEFPQSALAGLRLLRLVQAVEDRVAVGAVERGEELAGGPLRSSSAAGRRGPSRGAGPRRRPPSGRRPWPPRPRPGRTAASARRRSAPPPCRD